MEHRACYQLVTPSDRVTRLPATLYFLWPWSLHCSQGRGGNHWPALPDMYIIQDRAVMHSRYIYFQKTDQLLSGPLLSPHMLCKTLSSVCLSSFCLCSNLWRAVQAGDGPQSPDPGDTDTELACTAATAAVPANILFVSRNGLSLSLSPGCSAQTLPNTVLYRQI